MLNDLHKAAIREVLAEKSGVAVVEDDTDLEDLGLDSVDEIMVLIDLEERISTGREIPDNVFGQCQTVSDLYASIEKALFA